MEKIEYTNINRGTRGIFESIEEQSNRFCAKSLVMLSIVSFILVAVASIVDKSAYMHEVRIAVGIIIILSAGAGVYCRIKKVGTRYRKYALFGIWLIVLMLAVTFIDSSVSLLYAIPVILAIQYSSVIFTLFVSLVNIVFAFFPYIINTYRNAYPLDFIVLEPGTTIQMTGASLDETVNALSIGIERSETIMNMLSYGYLTTALLLVIISAIAVSATNYDRKAILGQYNKSRNSVEELKK